MKFYRDINIPKVFFINEISSIFFLQISFFPESVRSTPTFSASSSQPNGK